MSNNFRSGNSRLLAKTLDQLYHPIAVLDRKGVIVYSNARLCAMAGADATLLVGKSVSWQIAEDDTPFAAILTALAPPAGARQGRVVSRQLSSPIVYGSTETGQLFIPMLDADGTVHATLVILAGWEDIQKQVVNVELARTDSQRQQERALVHIRSRWSTLDGLLALIGQSPAVQLAMTRAQLSIAQPCNFFITGPPSVGKTETVRAVFAARLKKAGLQKNAGQLFPVACGVLDAQLIDGMLEVFAGRLRPDTPRVAQLMLLEHADKLTSDSVSQLNQWLSVRGSACYVAAISPLRPDALAARGAEWEKLISRIATIEISLPPLKERREDILPLANHLLASTCHNLGRMQMTFTAETLQLLTAFPWPENLAQLAQAIEDGVKHAVLSSAIQVSHLPVAIRTFSSTVDQPPLAGVNPIQLDEVLLDMERILLQRALKLAPRNRAQAARWLGISRTRLLRRIEQLGLNDTAKD